MLSVIPVKTAIKALLDANTWPTQAPTIRWGGPTEGEDQDRRANELVYFADVRDMTETHPTLGATRIDETYNLRLHIDVVIEGDDEQGAETRAWALYESLRRVLWTNHNLIATPGSLTVMLQDRTVNGTNVAVPGAWVSRVQVDQTVDAKVFNP